MSAAQHPAIGLLGGSFDPIHVGHLQLARDAAAQLGLAQVLFVPAGQPWQKAGLSEPAHRARMVELSIATEARFVLDTRELLRPGPSYTVDTLRELRREAGTATPLVLLIGADQFEQLDSWHRWDQLIELAHIGVARRAGHGRALRPSLAEFRRAHLGTAAQAAQAPGGVLIDLAMEPIDCSSTRLRALLGAPRLQGDATLAHLLAPPVLDYIRQHHLYR